MECRAVSFFCIEPNVSAEDFNYLLHDVQSQPCALNVEFANIVGAEKFFKDFSSLSFGDAVSGVADAQK